MCRSRWNAGVSTSSTATSPSRTWPWTLSLIAFIGSPRSGSLVDDVDPEPLFERAHDRAADAGGRGPTVLDREEVVLVDLQLGRDLLDGQPGVLPRLGDDVAVAGDEVREAVRLVARPLLLPALRVAGRGVVHLRLLAGELLVPALRRLRAAPGTAGTPARAPAARPAPVARGVAGVVVGAAVRAHEQLRAGDRRLAEVRGLAAAELARVPVVAAAAAARRILRHTPGSGAGPLKTRGGRRSPPPETAVPVALRPEVPPRLKPVAVAVDPALADVVAVVHVRHHDPVDAVVRPLARRAHRLALPRDDDRHPALAGDAPLAVDLLRVLQVDAGVLRRLEDDRRVPRVLVVRLLVVEGERREDDPDGDLVAAVEFGLRRVPVREVVEELGRRRLDRLLLEGDGRVAEPGRELQRVDARLVD